MEKGRTRRREVSQAELLTARKVAQHQVANSVRRELLEEHWNAIWRSKAALMELWHIEGLDPVSPSFNPDDSRVQLLAAFGREEVRVTRELSLLIDDSYGLRVTERSPDGTLSLLRRSRPFDALECAPEYERGENEDRDAARRRGEADATLRVLVERGYSPRAAAAALDPKYANLPSRDLPPAPMKRAERARDRRRDELATRLRDLERRRAETERDNGSTFQHIRRASLPGIDEAIAYVQQQLAASKK